MNRVFKSSNGQSIVLIAVALVGVIALLGLVVDAGNSYVQNRKVQNAMDTGAQAGAVSLAQGNNNPKISADILAYVGKNGVLTNTVTSYYVTQDTSGNTCVVTSQTIASFGTGTPPDTLSCNGHNWPVVGVQVQGSKTFDTYLAQIIGFKQVTVNGGAGCYAKEGVCSSTNLSPLALSADTFGVGSITIVTFQDNPLNTYRFLDNPQTVASNLNYVTWNSDTSANTVATNLNNPTNSGSWAKDQTLHGAGATLGNSAIQAALKNAIDNKTLLRIPIYNSPTGSGATATYNIKAFAGLRVTYYRYTNGSNIQQYGTCSTTPCVSGSYIEAKLMQWVDAQAEGGCSNYGGYSTKCRPQLNPTQRTLIGMVKFPKIVMTPSYTPGYQPVDVVEVIDLSPSMQCSFAGYDQNNNCTQNNEKMNGAKTAMNNLNKNLQPNRGDRAALVTFPYETNSSGYNAFCTGEGQTKFQWGYPTMDFTSNITGTNGLSATVASLPLSYNVGNTPGASGLQIAVDLVTGNTHTPGNAQVIIFASDGRTNVRLYDNPGQYAGNNSDNTTCNMNTSGVDLTKVATAAKARGIVIFSIAIGADFNGNTNIASPPESTHWYQATDAATMKSIYDQISYRLQDIKSETCEKPLETLAPYATISIRNRTTNQLYNKTTNAEGVYEIDNVDAGTFAVESASVTADGITYNVLTNGVGGDVLSASQYPTSTVGTTSGTFRLDAAVNTSTPPTCSH